MISAALSLFLLRDLPLSAFEVPRRQTVGVLVVLGVLVGMSLASLTQDDGMPLMTIPQALLVGLGLNALLYGLVHGVLRWWLMRDGRWDGSGPLFNLLLAAGLVPNVLSALLESLELPAGIASRWAWCWPSTACGSSPAPLPAPFLMHLPATVWRVSRWRRCLPCWSCWWWPPWPRRCWCRRRGRRWVARLPGSRSSVTGSAARWRDRVGKAPRTKRPMPRPCPLHRRPGRPTASPPRTIGSAYGGDAARALRSAWGSAAGGGAAVQGRG